MLIVIWRKAAAKKWKKDLAVAAMRDVRVSADRGRQVMDPSAGECGRQSGSLYAKAVNEGKWGEEAKQRRERVPSDCHRRGMRNMRGAASIRSG